MNRKHAVFSSIIVPTYNRNQLLETLLNALNNLNPKSEPYEVVLVDDGSTPPVSISRRQYRYPLIIVRQKNAGPAQARNQGAEMARGKHLVFIDDDCTPDPQWLLSLQQTIKMHPNAIIGGNTSNSIPNNPYSQATQYLHKFLMKRYSPKEHLGGFFPTNNFSMQKSVFFKTNGFHNDLRFGEDREFCFRAALGRHSFIYDDQARISHSHHLNLWSFIRLHFNYGGGSFHFRRLAARYGNNRIRFSKPTFYLSLILFPTQSGISSRTICASVLLLISQIANMVGLFWEWSQHKHLCRKSVSR